MRERVERRPIGRPVLDASTTCSQPAGDWHLTGLVTRSSGSGHAERPDDGSPTGRAHQLLRGAAAASARERPAGDGGDRCGCAHGHPRQPGATPVFYAAVLVIADTYNLFHPIPPSITAPIGEAAHALADANLSLQGFVLLAFIVTAPGIAVMVSLWLGVRRVLGGGVGALLLALGARVPRPGDLEERQIQNLVEEMALAAGVPAPQVRLIDSAAGNAAVVGTSDDEAIIIVSRGLLDDFSREDTQAIVGHLVGSISNWRSQDR